MVADKISLKNPALAPRIEGPSEGKAPSKLSALFAAAQKRLDEHFAGAASGEDPFPGDAESPWGEWPAPWRSIGPKGELQPYDRARLKADTASIPILNWSEGLKAPAEMAAQEYRPTFTGDNAWNNHLYVPPAADRKRLGSDASVVRERTAFDGQREPIIEEDGEGGKRHGERVVRTELPDHIMQFVHGIENAVKKTKGLEFLGMTFNGDKWRVVVRAEGYHARLKAANAEAEKARKAGHPKEGPGHLLVKWNYGRMVEATLDGVPITKDNFHKLQALRAQSKDGGKTYQSEWRPVTELEEPKEGEQDAMRVRTLDGVGSAVQDVPLRWVS
jgi:hypothetical protein